MDFRSDERAALFIDGLDLHATSRALGFHVDFRKLLDHFRSHTHLIRANYYAVLSEGSEHSNFRPLVDWLGYNGYVTITKVGPDPLDVAAGKAAAPGIAVELTIDALQLSKHLDHAIIFASSAEYRALLATLQKNGCRVTVVASRKASGRPVADELRRQSDQFIDLADLKSLIALDSSARTESARERRNPSVASGADDGQAEARRGDAFE